MLDGAPAAGLGEPGFLTWNELVTRDPEADGPFHG
jgi:hypothetical protein